MKEINSLMEEEKLITLERIKGNHILKLKRINEKKILKEARGKLQTTINSSGQNECFSTTKTEART